MFHRPLSARSMNMRLSVVCNIVNFLYWHSGFTNIFYVINFAVIDTFPKSSPSMVEKKSARDAHEKLSLFYWFISLKRCQ